MLRSRPFPPRIRHGVPRIFLTALPSYAAVGVPHDQGEKLLCHRKLATSYKEESAQRVSDGNAYLFAFNDRYDIDGKTLKNTARYINHSCDPNCEAVVTTRTIWIVALRDITAGEELSYNYGLTAKQYRCTCGATKCCGYILDPAYW